MRDADADADVVLFAVRNLLFLVLTVFNYSNILLRRYCNLQYDLRSPSLKPSQATSEECRTVIL